mmetsp:Transcript_126171/g.353307  ORF Transcript_126171/g.353307 Transcript_126171/m.353307 type:complete len:188 (+) Transcript_126171:47-610(+)
MATITEYKLISTDEEYAEAEGARVDDWKTYPANRRIPLQQQALGQDLVFLRTGGNALQAVSRKVIEQQQLISVVVPEGKDPGDEILVACPFVKDRLICVTIPKNATAGSVFLVQPPLDAPEIFTGIPVEMSCNNNGSQTPIVNGSDIDELALQEEPASEQPLQNRQSRSTQDPDEEEYEMVHRDGIV